MSSPYLGIERSLSGQVWRGPTIEVERQADALHQANDLPMAMGLVLARLGVRPDDVSQYLAPAIRDLLPDPRSLRDMEKVCTRFLCALERNEEIAIFADYDVDGGASAALLLDWLHSVGKSATLYVPDRLKEGYGPNAPALQTLATDHSLIICVDCGTMSHDAIAAASGADVIVIDHHLGGETLPPAFGVVNPNRQDETGDIGHLCAAGVVFLFLVEANRQRRATGAPCPDLMAMLDLVALATVADVAPLIGVNRAFVRQGLRIMAARNRPGLAALADVGKLSASPSAYALGFVFGPRVNAGGRIGKSDLGARLLSTQDRDEAASIAAKLDELNAERRDIEEHVRLAATDQIEGRADETALVWAAGDGWHPGVVGIVASRLKEAHNKPAIVIGLEGDEGKGSGRSISGVDLGSIIHRVQSEGLLTKGGGHKMAAGLSVERSNIEPAMARISELITRQLGGDIPPRVLHIDGTLMPEAITVDLIEQIETAGPFGASVPGPRFALPAQPVSFAKEVGKGHLKLRIGKGPAAIDAIAFGAMDSLLGQELMNHNGRRFHFVGRLDINHWQGRKTAQLRLEDAAIAP